MTRHKWAHVAEAFGNGKKVQLEQGGGWQDWVYQYYPSFDNSMEWRIKPEEPELVDMYLWAVIYTDEGVMQSTNYYPTEESVKKYFFDAERVIRLDYTKITVPKMGENSRD